MRQDFFTYLYELMKQDPDIYVLTGDLGYGGFDHIRDDFPARFINTGAAEQSMLDMAAGLAMEGKTAVVYSITPFLLYRGFETIRTYINHERLPILLIGSGRDRDYLHDGFSHDATDDREIMATLKNIYVLHPESNEQMRKCLVVALADRTQATYINLRR